MRLRLIVVLLAVLIGSFAHSANAANRTSAEARSGDHVLPLAQSSDVVAPGLRRRVEAVGRFGKASGLSKGVHGTLWASCGAVRQSRKADGPDRGKSALRQRRHQQLPTVPRRYCRRTNDRRARQRLPGPPESFRRPEPRRRHGAATFRFNSPTFAARSIRSIRSPFCCSFATRT